MCCYYIQYHCDGAISWIQLLVNSKEKAYFAVLFTLRERRRTSDSVLSRVRSKTLRLTLDAWTLKPSGACNVGVYYRQKRMSIACIEGLS